jgi:hypothetical protein
MTERPVTRTLAYRHFRESIVHIFTECPEGSLIGIARRAAIKDETAMEGLEVCEGCQARESGDEGEASRPVGGWPVMS